MTYLALLLFTIVSVGLTNIIVESELLSGLKTWFHNRGENSKSNFAKTFWHNVHYMTNCYQCSGFWSGFLVAFLTYYFGLFANSLSILQVLIISVFGGWAGSFLAVVAFYVLQKLSRWSNP